LRKGSSPTEIYIHFEIHQLKYEELLLTGDLDAGSERSDISVNGAQLLFFLLDNMKIGVNVLSK